MLQIVVLHWHSEDHRYWILNSLDSGHDIVICCYKIRLQVLTFHSSDIFRVVVPQHFYRGLCYQVHMYPF